MLVLRKSYRLSLRIVDDTLRANWRAPGTGITSSWRQSARGPDRPQPWPRGGAGRLVRSFTRQCFGWRHRRCVPCHNSHALVTAGIVRDRQVSVKVTALVDRDADDLTRGIDETCGAQIQRRTGGEIGR